ncbi:hypothetical protein BDN71DRAFT_1403185 [Pleurotus eryngii]|uniref:CENP-C homolog n=1 Tax=Pleurotus eryngii TaxID=5323 RepID=A0A9P5ZJE2_PLEER|nr:hypothetical protein BDN71DRAFT_1403185 [Pleurotus eryngii]
MPSSARKSSIGTSRRASQKGHIPYRGDNPEVGKKTGIPVRHVERKSDGFEPFEEVMRQADGRTPPRPKSKKQKAQKLAALDEEEDGEMSMELDDSASFTPLNYFKNARQQPLSAHRVGSSSRPVGRPSLVDYDQLPSPRRFSLASTSAGPSRLSRSFAANDNFDDDDEDDGGGDFEHNPPFEPHDQGASGSDDELAQQPHSRNSRRVSFSAMNEDMEEDEDEQPTQPPSSHASPSRRKSKGKGKATEEDLEEDFAQELDDLGSMENGVVSDNEQEEEQQRSPVEKAKIKRGKQPAKRTKRAAEEPPSSPTGVRRSKRFRFRPLEWWRQERVVYGRRDSTSGPVLVPHIKEVITIPQEAPVPLGAKHKRRGARGRSKSKANSPPPASNPEEGWDDDTVPHAHVVDFVTGEEVDRRIAYTPKMLNPQPAANADWRFEKVFGDGDFIASGELIIPPGCRKPSKPTKDNTYMFYIIAGAINLRIHNSSLILATGAMFMVPRGNTYFIENISQRDVRLFFTQARKLIDDEEPPQLQDPPSVASSRAMPAARSSSAGHLSRPQPTNSLKRAHSTRV